MILFTAAIEFGPCFHALLALGPDRVLQHRLQSAGSQFEVGELSMGAHHPNEELVDCPNLVLSPTEQHVLRIDGGGTNLMTLHEELKVGNGLLSRLAASFTKVATTLDLCTTLIELVSDGELTLNAH